MVVAQIHRYLAIPSPDRSPSSRGRQSADMTGE